MEEIVPEEIVGRSVAVLLVWEITHGGEAWTDSQAKVIH
jgi:hypothetical protein